MKLFKGIPSERLLSGGSVSCILKVEKRDSSHSLAEEAVIELLEKKCEPVREFSIKNDSSGAPYVVPNADVFLSLTDDSLWCGCIAALDSFGAEVLKGVGIDIMSICDAEDILRIRPHRLRRSFSDGELEWVYGAGKIEAVVRMAMLVSAKESAFKSMSGVLRVYRRVNNDGKLPVSFMDIEITNCGSSVFKAAPTGMLLGICRKEGLEIFIETDAAGELAGSLAFCRKKQQE